MKRQSLLFVILSGLVSVLYFHGVINYWWAHDTPFFIRVLKENGLLEHFYQPRVWQIVSSAHLTPMLIASLGVDLLIFKLKIEPYYIHQILSVAAVSFWMFMVLRLWIPAFFAASGAILFLFNPAVEGTVSFLMVRHYIEGGIWALMCIFFFVQSLRQKNYAFTVISTLFYSLAILSKEVYIPVVWWFVLLPERDFRTRLLYLIPHFVFSIFYLFYRHYMLGTFIGGYSGQMSTSPMDLTSLLYNITLYIGGSKVVLWWYLLVSVLCLTYLIRDRRWNVCLLWIAIVFFTVFPLLSINPQIIIPAEPLSSRFVFHYSIMFYALSVLACSYVLRRFKNSRTSFPLIALILLSIFVFPFKESVNIRSNLKEFFRVRKNIGRTILSNLKDSPCYFYLEPLDVYPLYMYTGREIKNTVISDDILLINRPDILKDCNTYWTYLPDEHRLKRSTQREVLSALKATMERRKEDAPLYFTFNYRDGLWHIRVGPYSDGQYRLGIIERYGNNLLSYEHPITREIKSRGGKINNELTVYVKYNSPEGWVTYSPFFDFDFNRDAISIKWSRKAPFN